MSASKMVNVTIAILVSTIVTGCAALQGSGVRLASLPLSSPWIDFTGNGMMGTPGGYRSIWLDLKNKSSKTLLVSVAFVTSDAKARCKTSRLLDSSQSNRFSCMFNSPTSNTDYPVEVWINSTEGTKILDLVEKIEGNLHFSEGQAKAFDEFINKYLEPETAK